MGRSKARIVWIMSAVVMGMVPFVRGGQGKSRPREDDEVLIEKFAGAYDYTYAFLERLIHCDKRVCARDEYKLSSVLDNMSGPTNVGRTQQGLILCYLNGTPHRLQSPFGTFIFRPILLYAPEQERWKEVCKMLPMYFTQEESEGHDPGGVYITKIGPIQVPVVKIVEGCGETTKEDASSAYIWQIIRGRKAEEGCIQSHG